MVTPTINSCFSQIAPGFRPKFVPESGIPISHGRGVWGLGSGLLRVTGSVGRGVWGLGSGLLRAVAQTDVPGRANNSQEEEMCIWTI